MAEHRVAHVMGMAVSIIVVDTVACDAVDRALAWLHEVDRTFSTYRDDSEISLLNRGALAPRDASAAVKEVLALCDDVRVQSGGFFDASAAGPLDPSGMVKGWAVERAAELLERRGAKQFYVNAGGDVALRGGEAWRVGIQHPLLRGRLACVVEISEGAIATSGAYERGAHIVNPRSGRRPDGVLSVTVLGRDLAMADAYATAAFAMGAAGPEWTRSLQGYEAMTILSDERVLCTPGFLDHCPGGSPAASLVGGA